MCRRKLVYLVSFVLVLGLAVGAAEATFDTVGVYDPNDAPHHNQVDQSGTYDSHTGNAGPENVIDLATFQELIGPAFNMDAGGVVDAEVARGSKDGSDIIANFGVSRTKSVTFTDTGGNLTHGSGEQSGGRQPTSGNARFGKADSPADWVFDISPITGGVPGEVVTYVAGTVIYRNIRELYPQVIATFSGGGTVTAKADMPMGAPVQSLDTFFGFVAPPGEGIVNVNFDMAQWTNLDDVAFITSAFVLFPGEASNPSPANEATDVPRDVVLGWKPGDYAPPVNGHTVYLSESFNNVNDGIGGITQDANSYTPPQLLGFGTTYYWRVDEVDGPPDFTVHPGEVWQFTTELFSYPIAGTSITATASSQFNENTIPENTINGSGLDENDLHSTEEADIWLSNMAGPQPSWIQYEFDRVYKLHQMWVWNFNQLIEPVVGFGFKEVTIEYSTNGTDWAVLADVPEFAQAPGAAGYAYNTTVDLGGVAARYVKITANSNWGGILNQYGLSEVRFFYIPVYVREPYPDSGATDVDVDVVLDFRAGREAAKHDVYLSTDQQAVVDGTAAATTMTETSYGPLSLDLGKTYYWRVDEVNEAETPNMWQGDVWDFATKEYFVVDDIESYNDLDPGDPESNRIFNTWIDGYEQPTNGSLVGYDVPPFCEQTIVHGDKQAMPFFFSNTGTAAYSEAELTLTPAQDWTKHGVKTLSLWFSGAASNTAAQMYVKVNGSKVTYDGDASNLTAAAWQPWNIELVSFGAGLQNVTRLAIGIDGNGATGTLLFDDIRLYPYDRQLITPAEPSNAGLVGHYKLDQDATDSSGNNNHGTLAGNPQWTAGKIGGALAFDGDDYVDLGNPSQLDFGTGSWSVSAWIKMPASTDNMNIFAKGGDNTGGIRYMLNVSETDDHKACLTLDRDSPSPDKVQATSSATVDDDQWHHIVGIRDGSSLRLYVDGVLDGTNTLPAGYDLSGTSQANAYIGAGWRYDTSVLDKFLIGVIDDVRIYGRVLTEEEIAWLAGRTKPFDKPF